MKQKYEIITASVERYEVYINHHWIDIKYRPAQIGKLLNLKLDKQKYFAYKQFHFT